MVRVREVIPALDFWRLPPLLNTVEREPVTMDTLFRWHFRDSPGRIQRRVVAEDEGGALVGYGMLNWEADLSPHEFYLWVMTHPNQRGVGIGSTVYADLTEYAYTQGAVRLTSEVADNDSISLAWAERRGFGVARHNFTFVLDVNAFDERPFMGVIERLEAVGIRFATMADFPNTPPYQHHLFELNRETVLDIPGFNNPFPSFEVFRKSLFETESYQPEGQWIALQGDKWIGMSAIRYTPDHNSMYNTMTGVRRAYRGQGIALALKLFTIRYAKQMKAVLIRTHNNSANAPMQAINRKLGYVPEAGIYWLRKKVEG